jgi:hypothetical protein
MFIIVIYVALTCALAIPLVLARLLGRKDS